MREMTAEIGGKELRLVANFRAAQRIAERVADPMLIARESLMEYLFTTKNIPYTPKWGYTVENVPQILHIAAEEAGMKITLKEMQELVFEHGFINARATIIEYLQLIVGPKTEEPMEEAPSEGKN